MASLPVIWWQVGDMQGGQSSAAHLLSVFSFQARTRELENLQHTVEELQAQVHSMDGAKGWFERRLKEAEESLLRQEQEQEETLKQCREQHAAELKVPVAWWCS